MLTMLLALFWLLLSRSRYAPWDLPPHQQDGLWSNFCVVVLLISAASFLITIAKWLGPIVAWAIQYSDWLF